MHELTRLQRCWLGSHGCFLQDDSDNPGWTRFYSAKPRFPINIAFPPELVTKPNPRAVHPDERGYGYWRFNPYAEVYQELEFPGRFIVARHDLNRHMPVGDLLRVPLLGGDIRKTYRQRRCRRQYRIGGLRDSAPDCIRYDNGAVRVWFQSSSNELWSYERAEDFPDDVFARILQEAYFLPERFFSQLPPPLEGIECYPQWEAMYFSAWGGKLRTVLGVSCDVDELAERWPNEHHENLDP